MKNQIGSRPPRVLVVEDDRSVRGMLRMSLEEAGFEFAEASSGEEAVALLEQQPPEAVVLDLSLRDGHSRKVLDLLRHQEGSEQSAWVLMSALERQEVIKRYGPLQEPFLRKPFDPWDLVRLLKELFGTSQAQRPV